MQKMHIKTAFILGAGLGTRLRPLTANMPKPLLPIGGRPLITYAMEHLCSVGIKKFIVNTHHRADKYAAAFPAGNWRGIPIIFRHEPVLLDTGGGIKNIEDLVAAEDRFIVCNGDIITNMPLQPLLERHLSRRNLATLALRSYGPLLNVNIDQNGFICDMRHLLGNPGQQKCLFAGIYILEKSFLSCLQAGRVESIVPPLVEQIKRNPRAVSGVVIDEGYWYDLGTIEEYNRLNQTDGESIFYRRDE